MEGDAAEHAVVSLPAAGRELGVRGAPLLASFPLLRLAWPAGYDLEPPGLGRPLPHTLRPELMQAGGPSDQQTPSKVPTLAILAPPRLTATRGVPSGCGQSAEQLPSITRASPSTGQSPSATPTTTATIQARVGDFSLRGFVSVHPRNGCWKSSFPALGTGLAVTVGCRGLVGKGPALSVMPGGTGVLLDGEVWHQGGWQRCRQAGRNGSGLRDAESGGGTGSRASAALQ